MCEVLEGFGVCEVLECLRFWSGLDCASCFGMVWNGLEYVRLCNGLECVRFWSG